MTDFNLIKLDGKPIEKLLDVVSNAIGTVYKRYYYEVINQSQSSSSIKWVVAYHNDKAKEILRKNLITLGVDSKQIEMIPWSDLERN